MENIMAIATLDMTLSKFRQTYSNRIRNIIANDYYRKSRVKLEEIEMARSMPDSRGWFQQVFYPINWAETLLNVELKFANDLRALGNIPAKKLILYWGHPNAPKEE